jgi:hypothetical protein
MPPNPNEKILDILPSTLTQVSQWPPAFKQKIQNITRGDLMRLGGWMPRDPYTKAVNEALSPALQQLTIADLKSIAEALEEFNGMSYGTSIYFCCTCL